MGLLPPTTAFMMPLLIISGSQIVSHPHLGDPVRVEHFLLPLEIFGSS